MNPFSLDHIFPFNRGCHAQDCHGVIRDIHAPRSLALRPSGANGLAVALLFTSTTCNAPSYSRALQAAFPLPSSCQRPSPPRYSVTFATTVATAFGDTSRCPTARAAATLHAITATMSAARTIVVFYETPPRLFAAFVYWRYGDLNPRPMACKATALATELYPRGHDPRTVPRAVSWHSGSTAASRTEPNGHR